MHAYCVTIHFRITVFVMVGYALHFGCLFCKQRIHQLVQQLKDIFVSSFRSASSVPDWQACRFNNLWHL